MIDIDISIFTSSVDRGDPLGPLTVRINTVTDSQFRDLDPDYSQGNIRNQR